MRLILNKNPNDNATQSQQALMRFSLNSNLIATQSQQGVGGVAGGA